MHSKSLLEATDYKEILKKINLQNWDVTCLEPEMIKHCY